MTVDMMLSNKAIPLNTDDKLCLQLNSYVRNPNYGFDLKLDGTRVLAKKENGKITLYGRGTRNTDDGRIQTVYNDNIPELITALESLDIISFEFDGEAVVYGPDGFEDFSLLQKRITRKKDIEEMMIKYPVVYVIFDVLEWNGIDYTYNQLHEREKVLDEIFNGIDNPFLIRHPIHDDSENKMKLAQFVLDNNREGVMVKDLNSLYHRKKSNDWIKSKRIFTEDLFIMGYSPGTGKRKQYFGALHCYKMVDGIPVWVVDVGGGFDDIKLGYFTRKFMELDILEGDDALEKFNELMDQQRVLVIEINHFGVLKDGRRHPNFLRIRTDKDPESCDGESR